MTSNFSRMPSVTISRSKFKRKSQHKTSLKLGELTPIYIDEVLPGDTRSIDIASLIRMSTPVAPVMDNIYLDVYAFFVPNRLVWQHWKEFMGENNSSAGIYSGTEYTIPVANIFGTGISVGSVGDHFGLPVLNYDVSKQLNVSVLPIRGMRRIYNRFFRDQNVIAPATVFVGDSYVSGDSYNVPPFKVAKVSDYFTRALPYAQKGAPVSIPIAGSAPLLAGSTMNALGGTLRFGDSSGNGNPGWYGTMQSDSGKVRVAYNQLTPASPSSGSSAEVASSNLYVDLASATATTINELRFAFQYQKLLEKDALYGTRLNTR